MTELASYACHPENSRGRLYAEPSAERRTCHQRDRDRIIHSSAFRKLEYKTQVFVNHEGDYYRTRLTHTLEVSQIGRSIARPLRLNEDLVEALALAHDLGHTPFGHAGEDALNEVMEEHGGFDHNIQTLRILTELEKRYADFDGLNLTWEALEGTIKHNGPINPPFDKSLRLYLEKHDLEVDSYASLEAQVAAISDDIAYNNHDIDDGFRAGLFDMEELFDLPLIGPTLDQLQRAYPDLSNARLVHEMIRRIINEMIQDLLTATEQNIKKLKPKSVEDIRQADKAVVGFSAKMSESNEAIRAFLHENMYRHYRVNRMISKSKRVVTDLFTLFFSEPECLPTEWRTAYQAKETEEERALVVSDYIAGMTDRYAMVEHRRLFDIYASSQ